tara:strand:- start:846 stop:1142 length:297 start_codon:yes stop_codon:yes gene_type:complete
VEETNYHFKQETLELEVLIPEFIEIVDDFIQVALSEEDLDFFYKLQVILDDGIEQLESCRNALKDARQAMRAQAYYNYKKDKNLIEEYSQTSNKNNNC